MIEPGNGPIHAPDFSWVSLRLCICLGSQQTCCAPWLAAQVPAKAMYLSRGKTCSWALGTLTHQICWLEAQSSYPDCWVSFYSKHLSLIWATLHANFLAMLREAPVALRQSLLLTIKLKIFVFPASLAAKEWICNLVSNQMQTSGSQKPKEEASSANLYPVSKDCGGSTRQPIVGDGGQDRVSVPSSMDWS